MHRCDRCSGRLTNCFQARYRSHEAGIRVFADEPVERLQVNAVVYSARRHEAWLFGDCQIMVNGVQTPTTKDVDVLLGDLRAFTVLALREMQDGTPDVPISGSFSGPRLPMRRRRTRRAR